MNSNFNSKFKILGVIYSNFTSSFVVHGLYKLHNPFFSAKFMHGSSIDFSWYSIECLFKVKNSEVQFAALSQMFFLQLSEGQYCIVVPRPGMKPNSMPSMNTLSFMIFSDDLFFDDHSLNSFYHMIKEFKTSVVTFYQGITFPLPFIMASPFPL